MHIVYFLNEHDDWIKKSFHKNLEHAVIVAQVCEADGYRTRIVEDGKIIREG
jgi:hypothetical protein